MTLRKFAPALGLAALLAMSLTYADGAYAQQEKNWRERCGNIADLANTIMDNRQIGVSMRKQMEALTGGDSVKSAFEQMIISAYDVPRYSTKEMQEKKIKEFENRWYSVCVKQARKNK